MSTEYRAEYVANGHRVEIEYINTPKSGTMKIWIDRIMVSDEDGVSWRDVYETDKGLIDEAKSTIEMMWGAALRELGDNTFAAACFNDNTISDLRADTRRADRGDCESWGLTPTEWREQIKLALHAKLLDAVQEAKQ